MCQGLSVRELSHADIDPLIAYWLHSDPDFLAGMGVDLGKIPPREELEKMFNEQLSQPYAEKKSYCIIWLLDGRPIGHSNINKIIFGQEAYMHLHLWTAGVRQKGMGSALVRSTLPFFFDNFQLKRIFCEPYAKNPAPNRTLSKLGFKFLKTYTTTPGWINFEQEVNLWELSEKNFRQGRS